MKKTITFLSGLALLSLCAVLEPPSAGADQPPNIASLSVPQGGSMQILFHAKTDGPFRLQTRTTLDPSAAWLDDPNALVTKVQPGLFLAVLTKGNVDKSFYRIVSETETIAELKGWTLLTQVSLPANRQYFVAGESPIVTITILDTALGLTRNDFSTLNLYLYGPQDPLQTVTAVKLLNASTNRATRPHHYIDLKTNPNVQITGNVLTYQLQPVTDEAAGTYRVSVWSSLGSDAIQQVMKFADFQIGAATVEAPLVTKARCAACHEGPISGKIYMHHIDPGYSPTGNWSLDYEPVKSCKACHNQNGYAAIKDATGAPLVDPIVRRVHGVHMGEGLQLDFNTNSVTGDFRNYTGLKFPAEVKNCTACHEDDRWKIASRLACGACHDNVWFGAKTQVPAGMVAHPGGAISDDNRCGVCHSTDGIVGGVDLSHQLDPQTFKLPPPAFKQAVNLDISGPANGKFYVTGEAPKITIKITDAATGAVIDPKAIVEPVISTNVAPNEWKRANLFVSGPRAHTVPVLTTASANPNTNGYYANNDFRVRLSAAKEDPQVTRTADSIIYQLNPITNLVSGTYTAFAEILPSAGLGGWAYLNFQVGTTNIEKFVATNCRDCHQDTRMHEGAFAVTFTPDICKSCHDYLHQQVGKVGWGSANNGFGAAPLSRRVHGVHFGRYLNKPQEIHRGTDYSDVIFPQDVRNCTKCHAQTDSWTDKPSRLACLACHDSDAAITHGTLMTFDPTPQDAWSGDEVETCIVCHDKDAEFSPRKVHSITNPFVPPYPREPAKP